MTAQLDRDIFGNLVSRREASGTRRYYHPDGIGSTVALSDEVGGVAASMLYDAWGNARANAGAGHSRYRFTGAELDEASGLYHMGARFYDPAIGRWLSEDPVQLQSPQPTALNLYAYVWNAPTGFIDDTGLRGSPAQLLTGQSVHAAVARWFEAVFPGSETELRIKGFGLRLDMRKPSPSGTWEVYELKAASVFRNPRRLQDAIRQLKGYVEALQASGESAQAGGSWSPQGTRVPWNGSV